MALAMQEASISHAALKNRLLSSSTARSFSREPKASAARFPQLSVVIVNYRQWKETARLVGELSQARCLRSGAAEIVIIDNHSPAHPLAAKLRRRPGVSVRRWSRNRGFARAVNEGFRLSQGAWLLVLNPDLTPAPRWQSTMVGRFFSELGRHPGGTGLAPSPPQMPADQHSQTMPCTLGDWLLLVVAPRMPPAAGRPG
jgi:hypothetical protein